MRKVYKSLTEDQIARGVCFASTLSVCTTEQDGDFVHEVLWNDPDKDRIIRNLKDDSFFNRSPWKYNIIRH